MHNSFEEFYKEEENEDMSLKNVCVLKWEKYSTCTDGKNLVERIDNLRLKKKEALRVKKEEMNLVHEQAWPLVKSVDSVFMEMEQKAEAGLGVNSVGWDRSWGSSAQKMLISCSVTRKTIIQEYRPILEVGGHKESTKSSSKELRIIGADKELIDVYLYCFLHT